MRKYLLPSFLVLCLLIMGCSVDNQPSNPESAGHQIPTELETAPTETAAPAVPQITNKLTSDINNAALITMSVNPSFGIYINSECIVITVKANNTDAVAILSNNFFDGIPLKDCVYSLVDILYRGECLNNNAELNITAYTLAEVVINTDVVEMTTQAIEQFEANKNISLNHHIDSKIIENAPSESPTTSTNDPTEATTPGTTDHTPTADPNATTPTEAEPTIDESRFSEIERDGNGNIVKTVEIIPAMGDTPERTITCFYDPDGMLTQKIMADPDMTITDYFTSGVISKRVMLEGDYTTETTYNADGIPVSEIGVRDDYRYETTFYSTGIRNTETQYFDNGRVSVSTFYADGVRKSLSVDTTDDIHSRITYYPNGNLESEYVYGPNGDNKYYYDIDGNKVAYEGKDDHGYPVTGTYNSDGTSVFRTTHPNGTVVITYCDANGDIITTEYE